MTGRWKLLVAAALALATLVAPALALGPGLVQETHDELFARATDAYRRGGYEEADALWRSLLAEGLPDAVAARVYYDLGNAAWRRGEALTAVGWYTSCIHLDPRHEDAWANLELVRAEAGLEPADRGDLRSTVERLLSSLRPAEARLLVLAALGLFAVVLLCEAVFGGRTWRRLSLLALILLIVASGPWIRGLLRVEEDPLLVIGTPNVALRSEPRTDHSPIGQLDPGQEVERIDALPGWVRVETGGGDRGWVSENAVFALPR